MDECIPFLKHFLPTYVSLADDHDRFYIEEKTVGGEGKTFFSSASPCVVIRAKPAGPLLWSLKNGKIGEGAVLTKDDDGYHLHILEMKSKLTQSEWAHALLQFQGMLLTSLATVRLLGVTEVTSVVCYIAYKQEAMSASKSADLVLLKTFVGIPNPVGGEDEWSSEVAELPIVGPARIRKAQRDANNNADFGVIN
jgi:hypothetical protein